MQNKKRTGFISILIIILCLSVCIGATYAYFTDSVKSEGNIIKSGKLDVTMEWANGTTDPANTSWTDASTGAIFNYDLWEPGYTDVRHIRIENVGNLAFQYKLVIVANGEVSELADVIDVYYFDPAAQIDERSDLIDGKKIGTLTQALAGMDQTATGNLKADESVTVTIALKMQENADNKYQNLSIGTDFSIQLYATQYTYESDAFDNQYDCLHAETEVIAGYPATYEATGLTDGEKCTACGSITKKQEEIPMLDDLAFTLVESADGNYYTVKGTTTTGSSVVIPSTHHGLPVKEIEQKAFSSNRNLKNVTIPESVTTIGNLAFYYCSNLTGELIIPDSVNTIGAKAFYHCSGLTDLTIGDRVTTIGDSAFCFCSGLTTLTIGNSVTTIGNSAFHGCSNLTGELIIPDSVNTIGAEAFYSCSGLTDLTIGNSAATIGDRVTTIGDRAFCDCSGLTTLTIGNSVTTIGYEAFQDCSELRSVTLGESLTSIGGFAFFACTSLTTLTIPNSVTTIGNGALQSCENLESVTIGNSVTTIGKAVFTFCDSLTSIEIPDSVTFIDVAAFSECYNLVNVTLGNSLTSISRSLFENCASLSSIEIPDSVTTIDDSAFSGCSSLRNITIPDSVISIGCYAFRDCTGLASVVFEDTTSVWSNSKSTYGAWTQQTVTNATTNARYFTSTYVNCYWKKS